MEYFSTTRYIGELATRRVAYGIWLRIKCQKTLEAGLVKDKVESLRGVSKDREVEKREDLSLSGVSKDKGVEKGEVRILKRFRDLG